MRGCWREERVMMRVEMNEEGEYIGSRRPQRRGTEGPSKREKVLRERCSVREWDAGTARAQQRERERQTEKRERETRRDTPLVRVTL